MRPPGCVLRRRGAHLSVGPPVVQVNGADVVKVGHRQVVSLIRQGGSRLLMKVVSVSRKSESNLIRKKGFVTSFSTAVKQTN